MSKNIEIKYRSDNFFQYLSLIRDGNIEIKDYTNQKVVDEGAYVAFKKFKRSKNDITIQFGFYGKNERLYERSIDLGYDEINAIIKFLERAKDDKVLKKE